MLVQFEYAISPRLRAGPARQTKRLLRHCRAMTRDLLPFTAHLDDSVRADDGVRAMFALEQTVIGVLVGRHRRIAVHAHLEFRQLLAVCLEVFFPSAISFMTSALV